MTCLSKLFLKIFKLVCAKLCKSHKDSPSNDVLAETKNETYNNFHNNNDDNDDDDDFIIQSLNKTKKAASNFVEKSNFSFEPSSSSSLVYYVNSNGSSSPLQHGGIEANTFCRQYFLTNNLEKIEETKEASTLTHTLNSMNDNDNDNDDEEEIELWDNKNLQATTTNDIYSKPCRIDPKTNKTTSRTVYYKRMHSSRGMFNNNDDDEENTKNNEKRKSSLSFNEVVDM